MRLFYILILFLISTTSVCYASKKIAVVAKELKVYPSFSTHKTIQKASSKFLNENDELQKDIISNHNLKTLKVTLYLILLLSFVLSKNKISNIQTVVRKLRNNYLPLFKMLYQKHVFW